MKYKILLLAVCSLGYCKMHAQAVDLYAKAQGFANEVFQDCPQYTQEAYINKYVTVIERVQVTTEPFTPTENYQKLSTLNLNNKCNQQMQNDAGNFNPETFNPLKYNLDYSQTTIKKYRVDNTNYVIVVNP